MEMEPLKTYSLNNTEEHSDSSDFEDPSTDTCNPVNYYMMPKFRKKNVQRDKKRKESGSIGTTLNVSQNNSDLGDAPDIVRNTRKGSVKHNLRNNTALQQNVRTASDKPCTLPTKKDTFITRSDILLKPGCHNFQIEKGIVKSFSKASHEVYYVKKETNKIINNRKFEKLYAIEPVLTIDGNIYGLPVKSLKRNSNEDCLDTCSLTSSIESVTQKSYSKGKHENSHKNKKEKRKILKETKIKNNPYYIYTSSSQFKTQETSVANCETCDASSSMRSNENPALNFSPSKIWNFLINRGFSIQEDNKLCRCSVDSQNCKSLNCPHSMPNKGSTCSLNNRQTTPLFLQPTYASPFPQPSQATPPGSGTFKCPCGATTKMPPQGFRSQLKRTDPINCDCPGNKNKTNISHGPHNQIVQRLEEQYKSQVLCIHNPPCVLINGCLNITKPSDTSLKPLLKPTQNPAACPPKVSHGIIRKKKVAVAQKCDKSCQFHRPYVEMFPCELENKSDIREQMTQSLCYHDPPCNLVPGCRRHAGFFADTRCHHVPICQDFPECSVDIEQETVNKSDTADKTTNRTKNCEAFYMCNGNTGFCNKSKSECPHKPRCILIPKCLCYLIGLGYLSREVMPDCAHKPRCELVPACYFKTLEMGAKPEVGLPTKTARVPIYYQHKIFSRFKFRKL